MLSGSVFGLASMAIISNLDVVNLSTTKLVCCAFDRKA